MLTILFKMVSIYFKKQLVIPICTDVASTSCLYNNSIRKSAQKWGGVFKTPLLIKILTPYRSVKKLMKDKL